MPKELNLFEKNVETVTQEKPFRETIKKIIEGLLFSSSDPLPLQRIKEIIEIKYVIRSKDILEMVYELQQEYYKMQRAIQIDEIAGGFILRTHADIALFLEALHANRRSEKLSKASMEVLAIIAYRCPITRSGIESIRGVDSSGAIYSLLERQLIEVVGSLEAPGRPRQYGITKKFLQHFGLNHLKELAATK